MISKYTTWPALTLHIFILLIFISSLSADEPWSRGESNGNDLNIQLITFGPGDLLTTFFGHTAIVVQDKRLNRSRLYNFGLFSIEKDFLVNFAQGRLIFYAGDARVAGSLLRYSGENRDVIMQTLNLNADQKVQIAKKLAWWVLPENHAYLYHHYLNNCSTIPRDILDDALGNALFKATKHQSVMTFRDFTKRYTAHKPLLLVLLMFLMNDSIDKPIMEWDDMFLPYELQAKIGRLTISDSSGIEQNLVTQEKYFYRATRDPVPLDVPSFLVPMLLGGIGLGVLSLITGYMFYKDFRFSKSVFAIYNAVIGLILGIAGTVLFLMSMFTDHVVTYNNENLFLANPLTLVAGIASIVWLFQKNKFPVILPVCWTILGIGSLSLCLLKFFPSFNQQNYWEIGLILPINVMFAFTHIMGRKYFKFQVNTKKS